MYLCYIELKFSFIWFLILHHVAIFHRRCGNHCGGAFFHRFLLLLEQTRLVDVGAEVSQENWHENQAMCNADQGGDEVHSEEENFNDLCFIS